ncbi:hypothetical protein CPB83DRAFT_909174 [Crepidotus variabilis]|uniref:Uncharacterized protein n=1 Tax=Crepidotus variabilis TaxID=179855 RepID=A0A9P6EAI4_9AGAR|nr:hypothetical protein CPB83DRAFT_909174 [Crepidotus variabilis]
MSAQNRSFASSSSSSPRDRIRQLWPVFEQSVSKSRSLVDHKVKAAVDKADKEYEKLPSSQQIPITQHYANKARIMKELQDPHFEKVRRQWEDQLKTNGLRMDDWADISAAEMTAVTDVLGDPEDEGSDDMVVVLEPTSILTSSAPSQPYSTLALQPIAPSLSSSTRSTNISTASSYALVDPSAFNSEDEDGAYFVPIVATSHDLTSDDDDSSSLPLRRRQKAYAGWGSSSASSSLHESLDDSSDGPFARPPLSHHNSSFTKGTSAGQQAVAQSTADKRPQPKGKLPRQAYTGPSLDDAEEPLSDEEDFERFKMDIRIRKIVEFHQAAALADIELAIAIYKDRKAENSDKLEVSSKVTDHQKRMSQLQNEKEEERKNIVKTERSKRRSDLRSRPGRSGTLVAPRPSVPTNPSWLNDFHDRAPSRLQSDLDIAKILSEDSDESQGNVDKLLQQLFPMSASTSSSSPPRSSPHAKGSPNHYQTSEFQDHSVSTPSFGWGVNLSSTPAVPPASTSSASGQSQLSKRRLSTNVPPMMKSSHLSRPSLFGDDESGDEDVSPPPSAQPLTARPTATANDFFNHDASAMLSNQLMAEPDLVSAFAQWSGGGGGASNGYQNQAPQVPSWGPRQAVQTPTVDNPNPWGSKEPARSTPLTSGWNKRKLSFSAGQSNPADVSFTSFGHPETSEHSASLATMAAFNSVHTRARKPSMSFFDPSPTQNELTQKPSPPLQPTVSTPATKAEKATPPAPVSTAKKLGKKQRPGVKKTGGSNFAQEEQDQDETSPTTPSTTSIQATSNHDGPTFSSPSLFGPEPSSNSKVAPMTRARKNSTAWDDVTSTPRPAPKIPSHLQAAFANNPETGLRQGLAPKSKAPEVVRGGPEASTIKGTQWGAASAVRSAWSIFSSGETAQSQSPVDTPAMSQAAVRDPWLPGGFEVDEGAGNRGEISPSEGKRPVGHQSQFWAPPTETQQSNHSAPPRQQPISVAQRRLQQMNDPVSAPAVPAKSATPAAPTPVAASQATGKKGKGKKGKGKKVTVEEVPDDEQDSHGESLPVDSRYIMEPKTIAEPKPSVAPRMFDSIIGYGDGDEDEAETTSSSFAPASSTTFDSPPDLFDGNEARLAAAIKDLQGASARGPQHGSGMTWGAAGGTKQHATWTPSSSESEMATSNFSPFSARVAGKPAATPVWGQMSPFDKGKASAANLGGNDFFATPMSNPTIPNMKRSKVAAGW